MGAWTRGVIWDGPRKIETCGHIKGKIFASNKNKTMDINK